MTILNNYLIVTLNMNWVFFILGILAVLAAEALVFGLLAWLSGGHKNPEAIERDAAGRPTN